MFKTWFGFQTYKTLMEQWHFWWKNKLIDLHKLILLVLHTMHMHGKVEHTVKAFRIIGPGSKVKKNKKTISYGKKTEFMLYVVA